MAKAGDRPRFEFVSDELCLWDGFQDIRIRYRPEPVAVMKRSTGTWKEFWPEFRLLAPVKPDEVHAEKQRAGREKAQAFQNFRSTIPSRITAICERFPSHQWRLLQCLARESAVMDLGKSNPVMAYCLANNSEFRETTEQASTFLALRHSHRKQREILEWLGFPGTDAVTRLLKKIASEAVTPSRMRLLRSALKADNRVHKLLAHHESINAGMLDLVTRNRLCEVVTPGLLTQVAGDPEQLEVSVTADRLMQLMELARHVPEYRSSIKTVSSVERLSELYRQVERAYHERRKELVNKADAEKARLFPSPPVPGTDTIEPIMNSVSLNKEGEAQKNCVAMYEWRIVNGDTYIYRVLKPSRATLAIKRQSDGSWRRSELEAAGNRTASIRTVRAVDAWLESHSISL